MEIEVTRQGQLLRLVLNRPEVRNAMNLDMMSRLADAIADFREDPALRVAVVTGAGDLCFCAGADLHEMETLAAAGQRIEETFAVATRRLYTTILTCDKPVIAVLNGAALAGGAELAMAAHMRIAVDDSYLTLTEARRGLAAHSASVMLPRVLPRGEAIQTLIAARPISARRAFELGFVQECVPRAHLPRAVDSLVADVLACAPLSVQRILRVVGATSGGDVETALTLDPGPDVFNSADRAEGIRAFREKRAPVWSGR